MSQGYAMTKLAALVTETNTVEDPTTASTAIVLSDIQIFDTGSAALTTAATPYTIGASSGSTLYASKGIDLIVDATAPAVDYWELQVEIPIVIDQSALTAASGTAILLLATWQGGGVGTDSGVQYPNPDVWNFLFDSGLTPETGKLSYTVTVDINSRLMFRHRILNTEASSGDFVRYQITIYDANAPTNYAQKISYSVQLIDPSASTEDPGTGGGGEDAVNAFEVRTVNVYQEGTAPIVNANACDVFASPHTDATHHSDLLHSGDSITNYVNNPDPADDYWEVQIEVKVYIHPVADKLTVNASGYRAARLRILMWDSVSFNGSEDSWQDIADLTYSAGSNFYYIIGSESPWGDGSTINVDEVDGWICVKHRINASLFDDGSTVKYRAIMTDYNNSATESRHDSYTFTLQAPTP